MKSTSGKILASVALVGTAAAVAGMGTFGAFTGSTSASQEVTADTVSLTLGSTEPVSITAAAGMLPGDSMERFVTLTNDGTSDLAAITLTTALPPAAAGNLLTTDANGLKLTVESCSQAWTTVSDGPDACGGSRVATTIANAAIIGANRDLGGLPAKISKGVSFLKITTTLPVDAGNAFQGLGATVNFTFSATQPTGTVS
ncbi:TasA family protein [Pseudarthrobacter sp. NPDC092439]|uniref:TasA family protein n=1 Tax=unclassified Pseudarthrobacter TaxID=2647000 RepID=UPI0037F3BA21